MGGSAPFTFGAWIALLGGIWFLFDKSESVASSATKRSVSAWLRGIDPMAAVAGWPAIFGRTFDHVFDAHHLTWRCFGRSCIASLGAVGIVSSLGIAMGCLDIKAFLQYWRVGYWETPSYTVIIGVALLAITVVLNFIPDYLSLLETRYVIGLMSSERRPLRLLLLLLADLVATAMIAVAALFVLTLIADGAGVLTRSELQRAMFPLTPASVVSNFLKSVRDAVTFDSQRGNPPLGIWFYSTFFTSAWVWLYFVSGLLIKACHHIGLGIDALRGVLNLEEKPITSLGWVAILIASIAYWSTALAVWLRE